MAVALRQSRAPQPSSLADVIDVILDRGIVIDAYVRVSLVGIELVTIDARIVVASVDTYLRFAQMVNRLFWATRSCGATILARSAAAHGSPSARWRPPALPSQLVLQPASGS